MESVDPKFPPGFTPSTSDHEKPKEDPVQVSSNCAHPSSSRTRENKKNRGMTSFPNSHSCLIDPPLDGYAFTWSHKNASKMSKLDRFLLSEGLFDFFPHLSAICLDKNLSNHRPILLRESCLDYGPTPFRFFHSWFSLDGFDAFVENTWNSLMVSDDNALIRLQRKLQLLKIAIKSWTKEFRLKALLLNELHEINSVNASELSQKAKIRWSIEGDENSKFFHGIINKKRAQLAIRGILADVKFLTKESKRLFGMSAVNKSPGPDGYTFEFFRKYWTFIGNDIIQAVKAFFANGCFPRGCNSSFIALIPKNPDAQIVKEFRPISQLGVPTKLSLNLGQIVMSVLPSH
ncbi:hypothetical protein Tco_0280599 [Tanacetum coccineum]